MFDIADLHTKLSYSPETGVFHWKTSGRGKKANLVAGAITRKGYVELSINSKKYQAHRIAWVMQYGYFPEHDIDHIDGNRSNNKISNLREATRSENKQNSTKHKDGTSGFLGVTWNKKDKAWRANICKNYKLKFLGNFKTAEEAHEAYLKAKAVLHTFNPVPRNQQTNIV